MSKTDTDKRFIPPGSCTWCGHKPHDKPCRSSIRTTAGSTKCPCSRRLKETSA